MNPPKNLANSKMANRSESVNEVEKLQTAIDNNEKLIDLKHQELEVCNNLRIRVSIEKEILKLENEMKVYINKKRKLEEKSEKEQEKKQHQLEKEQEKKQHQLEKEHHKAEKAELKKPIVLEVEINLELPENNFNWPDFFIKMEREDEISRKKLEDHTKKIAQEFNKYFYKEEGTSDWFYYEAENKLFVKKRPWDLKHEFDRMKYLDEQVSECIFRTAPRYRTTYEKNLWQIKQLSKTFGLINVCPLHKLKKLHVDNFNPNSNQQMINYMKKWHEHTEEFFGKTPEVQEFIHQWIAHALSGRKNESCIIMRGPEGIGKSSFSQMIYKCMPEDMCIENMTSDALHSQFNAEIENKVFVCIEENTSTNVAEWTKQASNLKLWSTAHRLQCEAKGKDRKTIQNLLNILVNTNEHTIVRESGTGRRFFIADLSAKRKGDMKYWNEIYEFILCVEFQIYFYNYYTQIVYNPNYDTKKVPTTVNKNQQALKEKKKSEPIAYFIHEEFYVKNLDINTENITKVINTYASLAKNESPGDYHRTIEFSISTDAGQMLSNWQHRIPGIHQSNIFYGAYFKEAFQIYEVACNGERNSKYPTSVSFYKKLNEMNFEEYHIDNYTYKNFKNIPVEQIKIILQELDFVLF